MLLLTHMTSRNKKDRLISVSLGFISGILYSLWLLGFYLNRPAFSRLDISALQATSQPHHTFFIAGDILTGIATILMAFFIMRVFSGSSSRSINSLRLCLIGIVIFGLMTAISCVLPSCIDSSRVCDTNLSQILDWHDITGGIASFALFLSLVGLLKFVHRKISSKMYRLILGLVFAWCISGILFVVLSIGTKPQALNSQRLFLILSSLCLFVIPFTINREEVVEN
ncbi:MAG TPA: DUF998 domain-containing protein [Candidatus Saccharimonadales bacterium]|jgi:hypothetical protein|nr:DUF998 domain-containing protein [Candidatus Saccharimonadales bacterium]